MPSGTIPTPRPSSASPPRPRSASNRTGVAGVGLLVVLAAALLLGAAPPEDGSQELARLAEALRAEPAAERYEQLAQFAEQQRDREMSAQAAFALGMADFRQERWAEARAWFGRALTSRWLEDYAAYHRARAAMEAGAFEVALASLDGDSFTGSALQEPAHVLAGDILVRAGRAQEALERLTQVPNSWSTPALLLARARAQTATGQAREAVEALHRIYYQFPLSPEAEPANELLGSLRAEMGLQYPTPGEALRRERAEKLWAAGAYRGARSAYVDLSVRAREPARHEARLRAALSLYNLGGAGTACKELARLGAAPPALEGEFRSLRARCDVRAGRWERAHTDLAYLAAYFPATPEYKTALLAAAKTAWVQGQTERARDSYRDFLAAFPSDHSTAIAHWRLAWLAYTEDDHPWAARLMEEHLKRFPESPYGSHAFYWRARLAANDEPLTRHLLETLVARAPRDYLAGPAREWLRRLQGAPAGDGDALPAWAQHLPRRPLQKAPGPLPPILRHRAAKAEVLERLGLPDFAGRELDHALLQSSHPELHLARARAAFRQQRYARATEILRRAHPFYRSYRLEELPREAWELMFPLLYWDAIRREARRQRIDPYLVLALIRQESRFEKQAISSAGALGLMQLMPRTARYVARNRRLSVERITDPDLNIRLGVRYLARLLRRFNGSLEKTVAAYNGGGTRVARWAREFPRAPAEFVESIPVTQTREFVHKVLRNYHFYRDLYADRQLLSAATGEE